MKFTFRADIHAASNGMNYRKPLFFDEEVALAVDGKVTDVGLMLAAGLSGVSGDVTLNAPHGGDLLRQRAVSEVYLPSLEMVGRLLVTLKSQTVSISEFFGTIKLFESNGWAPEHPLGDVYLRSSLLLPSQRALRCLGLPVPEGVELPLDDDLYDGRAIVSKEKLNELAKGVRGSATSQGFADVLLVEAARHPKWAA